MATLGNNPQSTSVTTTTTTTNAQRITVGNASIRDGIQRLATQTVTVKQGDSVQRIAVPSFAQLVQTSTGRHFILTPSQQNTNTGLCLIMIFIIIFVNLSLLAVTDKKK